MLGRAKITSSHPIRRLDAKTPSFKVNHVSFREISTTPILNATFKYTSKKNINNDAPQPTEEFLKTCTSIAEQESFRHAVGYTKQQISDGKICPTVNTFNKLFSLGVENPKYTTNRALQQLLNEMWYEHGVNPNEETFSTIINHLNSKKDPLAVVFYSHMTKHWGLTPNAQLITGILQTCLHNQQYRHADKIWGRLKRYGIKPDLEMFHIMLNIAREEKDAGAAATVVQQLHMTEGVEPTIHTFNILLKLLRDNVSTDREVTDVVLAMQECNLRPNDETKEYLKEWISLRDDWEREEILDRSKLDTTSLVQSQDMLEVVLSMGETMNLQKKKRLEEAQKYFEKLQNARVVNSRENRRSIWLTVASDFEKDYLPHDADVAMDTASLI
eukprot:gb/GECH01011768.1/.p1 GENE.gb/GECH01011768.1/~~gb/GECH01011768.1/.p1  ORF type:complete len:386 (+),score=67.99 gb/GECH01011768.1/:1-1158(+)